MNLNTSFSMEEESPSITMEEDFAGALPLFEESPDAFPAMNTAALAWEKIEKRSKKPDYLFLIEDPKTKSENPKYIVLDAKMQLALMSHMILNIDNVEPKKKPYYFFSQIDLINLMTKNDNMKCCYMKILENLQKNSESGEKIEVSSKNKNNLFDMFYLSYKDFLKMKTSLKLQIENQNLSNLNDKLLLHTFLDAFPNFTEEKTFIMDNFIKNQITDPDIEKIREFYLDNNYPVENISFVMTTEEIIDKITNEKPLQLGLRVVHLVEESAAPDEEKKAYDYEE